jgi:hypothetical protein
MVIFRTTDGKPAYHQTEVLDDAIRFVEHLRNEEQVTDARIFSLIEVPIEFRVQWRVEVAMPFAPPPAMPAAVVRNVPLSDSEVSGPAAEYGTPDTPEWAAGEPTTAEPEDEDEPIPVAVGAGDDRDAEDGGDEPMAPSAPSSSASSRFGLFSRG